MMFVVLLALAAAPAPVATIASGLWEVRNVPRAASMDGRPLSDLPLSPIKSERVCVSAADAAAPAAWFARDTADICRIVSATVAGGKVTIRGTCPTDVAGKEGALALDGTYDARRFTLAFATTTPQPEGLMGFTGTMTGRRLGVCVAAAAGKGK